MTSDTEKGRLVIGEEGILRDASEVGGLLRTVELLNLRVSRGARERALA
jgi:hypothetical protein